MHTLNYTKIKFTREFYFIYHQSYLSNAIQQELNFFSHTSIVEWFALSPYWTLIWVLNLVSFSTLFANPILWSLYVLDMFCALWLVRKLWLSSRGGEEGCRKFENTSFKPQGLMQSIFSMTQFTNEPLCVFMIFKSLSVK